MFYTLLNSENHAFRLPESYVGNKGSILNLETIYYLQAKLPHKLIFSYSFSISKNTKLL